MLSTHEYKIKLLHIAPHYGGGVGAVVLDLAECFQASGLFENSVLSLDQSIDHPGIRLSELGISFEQRIFFRQDVLCSALLHTDVVLLHYWNHPLLAVFLSTYKFSDCRLVIWSHTSGLSEPNIIPSYLYSVASQVVFTSAISLPLVDTKSPLSFPLPVAIHSTRNLSEFLAMGQSRNSYSLSGMLVYVGTVSRAKMHPLSLQIFSQLAAHGYIVNIIGEETDSELASLLSAIKGVNVLGKQLNVEKWLALADLFIYPLSPVHYGTGEQVILEAMAMGVPPICMNNPAEASIIVDKFTGILASSVPDFIESTLDLLSNYEMRKMLSINCVQAIHDRYSVTRVASSFVAIFSDLISRPTREVRFPFNFLSIADLPFLSLVIHSLSHFQNTEHQSFSELSAMSPDDIFSIFFSPKLNSNSSHTWLSSSKGSPFHYHRYFPDSKGIAALCSSFRMAGLLP